MPRRQRVEALIVGAGVAGLSAALWLRDFGVDYLVLEEALQPGGQLHDIHAPVLNYLSAFGWQGERIARAILNDARAAELRVLVGAPVTRIGVRSRLVERGAERYHAKAILIATGLRRRKLDVPGESELTGRGVSVSANADRTSYAGRPVVVVGGGTAAVEDALLCAEVGSPVTLLHRSTRFRARRDFLARALKNPAIRIVRDARISRIVGRDRVEGVEYRTASSSKARVVRADAVFVRVGWEPRTRLLRGQLRLDRAGYIRAGLAGITSVPGIYAAGDVCSPEWPSIANAAGQGATAAWEITRRLGKVG
jgi:thioredoxin reductase (NADPH)